MSNRLKNNVIKEGSQPVFKKNIRILIVSSSVDLLRQVKRIFPQKNYLVETVKSIGHAFEMFEEKEIDILLLSSSVAEMGQIRGMALLDTISEKSASTQTLFLAGPRDLPLFYSALKRGPYQYGKLPISDGELAMLIDSALIHQPSYAPNLLLKSEIKETTFENLVGGAKSMKAVYRQIKQAAHADTPVLLTGETGTGKDLVAGAIHQLSRRKTKAFVPIHLGALPPELVAGELFGYEKGAFTGATRSYRGSFEKAKGGTIFLDEISTIDEKVQISLLRLLETHEFERIGGSKTIRTNIRIIAATNENLLEAVEQNRFREDLFYRLDIFQIELPPVRKRYGDVLLLINHFLKHFSDTYDRNIVGISPHCIAALEAYDWPGNVREIKNVMHRAVLNCSGETLLPEHLPERFRNRSPQRPLVTIPVGTQLFDAERQLILQTLKWTRNNRSRSAKILGISRRALYNKLEKFGIS